MLLSKGRRWKEVVYKGGNSCSGSGTAWLLEWGVPRSRLAAAAMARPAHLQALRPKVPQTEEGQSSEGEVCFLTPLLQFMFVVKVYSCLIRTGMVHLT